MTTEERLAKVERELGRVKWRSRWLLAALGLGLGTLALVWASAANVPKAEAQGAAGERTVRANMFIVEDENGKTRATLGAVKAGPVLILSDENGRPRAMLSVDKAESRLTLSDENGELRATLSVGGPMIVRAYDENGEPYGALSAVKAGARLNLADENGKRIWSAP